MFTLIENRRMHGIDPCLYPKDILTRLPGLTNGNAGQLAPLSRLRARKRLANSPAS